MTRLKNFGNEINEIVLIEIIKTCNKCCITMVELIKKVHSAKMALQYSTSSYSMAFCHFLDWYLDIRRRIALWAWYPVFFWLSSPTSIGLDVHHLSTRSSSFCYPELLLAPSAIIYFSFYCSCSLCVAAKCVFVFEKKKVKWWEKRREVTPLQKFTARK